MPVTRAWRNDYRVWKWCRQNGPISDQEHERWFARQSTDPSIRMFAVTLTDGEKRSIVGVAGLTSIDGTNRRAEFSLYIAPDLHGKGLGRGALMALLRHGFLNLGLNVIWGETFDGNPAAHLFERVGMVREGTRRAFYFREGQFIDAHLYSMTRAEWDTIAASRQS